MLVYDIKYEIKIYKGKATKRINEGRQFVKTTKSFRTTLKDLFVNDSYFVHCLFELEDKIKQGRNSLIKKGELKDRKDKKETSFNYKVEYKSHKPIKTSSNKILKATIKKDLLRLLQEFLWCNLEDIYEKDSFCRFIDVNKYEDPSEYDIFYKWDIKKVLQHYSKQIDTDGPLFTPLPKEFERTLFCFKLEGVNSLMTAFMHYTAQYFSHEQWLAICLLLPNTAQTTVSFLSKDLHTANK